ncbi:DNA-binding LacI/PurR family transcriptional regulator [Pseudoclavibacter sp. JAI123]|uniref:LacI family DNA-binding transcriptional regulator n=1 Tax=Pseudoclavibacter sp. JAI123 TaxID=2723065 RepID=UPI0015C75101|nr:LacI family DNA-binding transcriptional regulator [Pseudoclavibacter sp. JAI123]NYF14428.1 DNA-binding LacI/PurR family transcriptional regulator [Pseudoclavibacter sp. JAI123]
MPPTSRQKRPTIYDVAERAGVSKSLVSLVLQNSTRVSDEKRAAVRTAIQELGYLPSRAATALAGNRTRAIGVMIDDFRNPWFVDLLEGMQEVLNGPGFHVTVADANLNAHLEQSPISGFLAAGVEGLVIGGDVDAVPAEGFPVPTVVAGNRATVPVGADLVANDDEAGARLAVEHLRSLGHTRIGHVTGSGRAAELRRMAYEAAMVEAGLQPRVVGGSGPTDQDEGRRASRELLENWPETTAVFAANDVMALGVLGTLDKLGMRVPDDISIVGYDDSHLAGAEHLSLTSVDDRSADVGRVAAELLLARIEGRRPEAGERGEGTRRLIQPILTVRGSTASADGSA